MAQLIGNYEVLRKLGAGGMGEVYLARDVRLGREVALKMLPKRLASDVDLLARFRREALTLASLNHPNIATIFGFEEAADGSLAIVLERVEGKTLAQRIREAPMPLEEALGVCAQVAEALEVAHGRGIVHRDLKPGNIMIGPRGLVKVLDFGLAMMQFAPGQEGAATDQAESGPPADAGEADTIVPDKPDDGESLPDTIVPGGDGESLPETHVPYSTPSPGSLAESAGPRTEVGAILGTPGYLSPEQASGVGQDARADAFSFGCVLFECLTGEMAFPGEGMEGVYAVLYGEPDRSLLGDRVPPRVTQLLDKSLAKDPTERLADMRFARTEIEEVLGIRRASALRTGEALETPHNLPKEVTSFIGRETELEAARGLLADASLVTLTGVGGCGKTRLALQLGRDLLTEYPDGVWFVSLAPVTSEDRVPETLGLALKLREQQGEDFIQTIVQHLSSRRALVLLDNCEHVIGATAQMVETLLQDCPDVRIIATSREALNVPGEAVHAVPTMALPDETAKLTAASVQEYESAKLFLERAHTAKPRFELSDKDAPVLADICRRLDGIPLALELAAARIRILSLDQIRSKLDDRFRLLTGGSRTALPRQQTLLATIQWSYDQLVDEEKSFFDSLAVFGGSWTLGAATAVCMESGDEFEVLDLLTRLADKSLLVIQQTASEDARYRFLRTVRQYASDRLAEHEEATGIRNRHLTYFLALAESAEKEIVGPGQQHWFEYMRQEHENFLAALTWCGEVPDGADTAMRLAGALARHWSSNGHVEIGRRVLLQALALDDANKSTSEPRAKALVRAGAMTAMRGNYEGARPLIEESLEIYRALEDKRGIARSLTGVASVAMCLEDFDAATRTNEEAMSLYEELGQKRGVAIGLHFQGVIARCRGDLDEAYSQFESALDAMRGVGDEANVAHILADLGFTCARRGDLEAARTHLTESLEIGGRLEARRESAFALDGVSALALASGDPAAALRWIASADGIREDIGVPLVPPEQKEHDAITGEIRDALQAGDGAAAVGGTALPFEAAVAQALEWLQALPGSVATDA